MQDQFTPRGHTTTSSSRTTELEFMFKLDEIESLKLQDTMNSSSFYTLYESLTSLESMILQEQEECCATTTSGRRKEKRTIFSNYWEKAGHGPVKPRPCATPMITSPCSAPGSSCSSRLLRRQQAVSGGLDRAITNESNHHHVRFDPKIEVSVFPIPQEQWSEAGWEHLFNA